jgi:hypothetical protein
MYLFLPSIHFPDNVFDAHVRELYRMRQMDFMPDLVIAKLITKENITYDDVSPGESETEISCKRHASTLIPRFRYVLLTEVLNNALIYLIPFASCIFAATKTDKDQTNFRYSISFTH